MLVGKDLRDETTFFGVIEVQKGVYEKQNENKRKEKINAY